MLSALVVTTMLAAAAGPGAHRKAIETPPDCTLRVVCFALPRGSQTHPAISESKALLWFGTALIPLGPLIAPLAFLPDDERPEMSGKAIATGLLWSTVPAIVLVQPILSALVPLAVSLLVAGLGAAVFLVSTSWISSSAADTGPARTGAVTLFYAGQLMMLGGALSALTLPVATGTAGFVLAAVVLVLVQFYVAPVSVLNVVNQAIIEQENAARVR